MTYDEAVIRVSTIIALGADLVGMATAIKVAVLEAEECAAQIIVTRPGRFKEPEKKGVA